LLVASLAAQWFPTDEELIGELYQIELQGRDFAQGRLLHWWDRFTEREESDERSGRLLLTWLDRNPTVYRFMLVANLLGDRGKRRDLDALLSMRPPVNDPEIDRAVTDADFAVKRRTLE
jgi:hypothetical protein